ncbi:hypothetical protein BP5796_06779 [Coleophoma crateriformis]|uniref:Uncharacterized protein n=1 Tax=Coleophoma crateriformis TaxID=565419 RepID=A0A3D8RPS7_9HELO|nr:hypothetical protein BP5796_06779 [Coleophoma crateriformis]
MSGSIKSPESQEALEAQPVAGAHLQQRRRRPLLAAIETFPPTYFAICMNAGIISILLHQLPYNFSGQLVLSTIAYLTDVVLFVIFSFFMAARLLFFRRSALHSIGGDIEQLCFTACWPIAWLTISAGTGLVVSQASWAGYRWTVVAYAFWWVGAAWVFVTGLIVYMTLFRKNLLSLHNATPALMLPAVGVATAASTGGVMINYSSGITATLQVPVIIVGYLLLGQGLFLSLVLYTIFLLRLFTEGFVAAEKMPSLILLLGPVGQGATALLVLSSAADTAGAFAHYHEGTFLQANAASALAVASTMLSLLLFGFGVFLLCISLLAIAETMWKRELKWTMTMWSTIFPMGMWTMNTAMLVYATEMNSPAWRVLTAALLLVLVIDFLICAGYTIYGVVYGDLLIPKDARKPEKDKL